MDIKQHTEQKTEVKNIIWLVCWLAVLIACIVTIALPLVAAVFGYASSFAPLLKAGSWVACVAAFAVIADCINRRPKHLKLIVLIVLAIALLGYGASSLFASSSEQSEYVDPKRDLTKDEAITLLQDCQVESVSRYDNGLQFKSAKHATAKVLKVFPYRNVPDKFYGDVRTALIESQSKCGDVPLRDFRNNREEPKSIDISLERATTLLNSCLIWGFNVDPQLVSPTGIVQDFDLDPVRLHFSTKQFDAIVPIAKKAMDKCSNLQYFDGTNYSRTIPDSL